MQHEQATLDATADPFSLNVTASCLCDLTPPSSPGRFLLPSGVPSLFMSQSRVHLHSALVVAFSCLLSTGMVRGEGRAIQGNVTRAKLEGHRLRELAESPPLVSQAFSCPPYVRPAYILLSIPPRVQNCATTHRDVLFLLPCWLTKEMAHLVKVIRQQTVRPLSGLSHGLVTRGHLPREWPSSNQKANVGILQRPGTSVSGLPDLGVTPRAGGGCLARRSCRPIVALRAVATY